MWRSVCSVSLMSACAPALIVPAPVTDRAPHERAATPADPLVASPPPDVAPAIDPAPRPSINTIDRADLERTLSAGLARFLQRVEVERYPIRGRFQGWRVVRSDGVPLHPNDVVLLVNGRSVERPEQAQGVWEELRFRNELTLQVLREGMRAELRFPIVSQPSTPTPPPR